MIKRNVLMAGLLVCAVAGLAENSESQKSIQVAEDGFPTGQETPEGAACDFARAFIKTDPKLLISTCLAPYGGEETRKDYQVFVARLANSMTEQKNKKDPSTEDPQRIGKCFAARHLRADGPASYGYAAFGFQDVMFVDVRVFLQNDKPQLCRTLVVKNKERKWVVHPCPDLSPLLSTGLNQESSSEKDFAEIYKMANKAQ